MENPEGGFSSFDIDSTMMSLRDCTEMFSREQHMLITSQKLVRWPQTHGTAWRGGNQPLHTEEVEKEAYHT